MLPCRRSGHQWGAQKSQVGWHVRYLRQPSNGCRLGGMRVSLLYPIHDKMWLGGPAPCAFADLVCSRQLCARNEGRAPCVPAFQAVQSAWQQVSCRFLSAPPCVIGMLYTVCPVRPGMRLTLVTRFCFGCHCPSGWL